MAYGKGYKRGGKKPRWKRPSSKSPGYRRAGLQNKVTTAGAVKRIMQSQAEQKFYDSDLPAKGDVGKVGVNTGGSVLGFLTATLQTGTQDHSIVSMKTGSGASERVGQRVRITSIQFQGRWIMSAAGTTGNQQILKMRVVVDKQSNSTKAVPGDIQSGVASGDGYWAPNNMANSERFTTLKEIHKRLSPGSADGVGGCTIPVSFYIKTNLLVHYTSGTNSTDNSDAAVIKNNVIFLHGSADNATTMGLAHLEGKFRVRYTDI